MRLDRSDKNGEFAAGTALTEFVILLPFMLLVLFGITDLGAILNQHLTLARVAYEGARYASAVPALAVASPSSDAAAGTSSGHPAIRDRVKKLLAKYGINPSSIVLTTERRAAASIPGATSDQVRVRISVPFQTSIPFVGRALTILGFSTSNGSVLNLTSDVSGPYLYNS